MKNNILLTLALLCALAWTGCQREKPVEDDPAPEAVAKTDSVWTLTVKAVKKDGPETKGLAIGDGDSEATTTTLKSIWKASEPVKVFLEDGTCIGTLTATPESDPHYATLSGKVTTTGITAGVTTLHLLTPRETIDYTGQNGKLLISDDATNSIEAKYHYTIAESVLVTDLSGSNITTAAATFRNLQSIYRLSFRYQEVVDGPKTAINTKSVTISGSGYHLVQRQEIGVVIPTEGDITVNLAQATTDPFFVAISDGFANGNEETFSFTVVDSNGITYNGSKTVLEDYNYNGTFLSIKNATLTSRLEAPLSSTTKDVVL